MISKFFKNKKRKEEEERLEKLENARDLWLNYKIHYFCFNITHRSPITGNVEVFKFPYFFTRKAQRDAQEKNKDANVWGMALQKAQGFLSKDGAYWIGGKREEGFVIREPLTVDFKEIPAAEYNKLQNEA